jgi:hypothetical protein
MGRLALFPARVTADGCWPLYVGRVRAASSLSRGRLAGAAPLRSRVGPLRQCCVRVDLVTRRHVEIEVSDPTVVPDLLGLLRGNGRIGYVTGHSDTIEALRTHSFGQKGEDEIRLLLDRWRFDHPGTTLELG